ncbi:MAG: TetR/AcrR family transcriptional regulator [Proteobacteria bacterium]|nr:TetR/AcrR family transcriptional regulator [Pseudomonadota bacterium]
MKAKSTRGASTRHRILSVAAGLMYKNGVNGTSVDDVLNASGTGKSQFYHYFTSKDALVKELISYHLSALPAAQEALLANLGTLGGLEAWLDQILADYDLGVYAEGCPIGNLASEMSGHSEELRVNLQATFGYWESCLTHGLTQLKANGSLRSDVIPAELATFWVAAIEGALLLAKTERASGPLTSTIRQIKGFLRASAVGGSAKVRPKRHGLLTFCP